MPRLRKIEADPSTDIFDAEQTELDAVLVGLPSDDSVITLWRIQPQGGPAYVAEFSPLDFSIEGIKNSYGGGRYKYYAKSNGSTIKSGTITVEGEPKSGTRPVYKRYIGGKLVYSKQEDADVVVGETPRSLNIESGNGGINAVLLTELRLLREAIQRPVESRESIKKDFLEEMMLFKQLFAPAQTNPVHDLGTQAVDLIKQGIEIANLSEGGGSPWMMILDKVMPTIQDVLKVVSQQQARQVQPQGPSHMPNQPPEPAALPPSEPKTGFDAIADDLKVYLPTFIRAASIGTDPMLLVDMTIPNIPPDKILAVIDWLNSDRYFEDIVKLHPSIMAQQLWWQDYRTGLLDALSNPPEIGHDESEVQ